MRNYRFDVIRVAAMVMVLLNHTLGAFILDTSRSAVELGVASVSMVLSRLGVPLFLMLTGALLLEQKAPMDWMQTIKKRVCKVLLPLLCWSLLYYIFYDVMRDGNFSVLSLLKIGVEVGNGEHLWYLYILLILYAFLPILHAFVEKSPQYVYVCIAVWALVVGVLPYISDTVSAGENLHLWGYLLLGWFLARCRKKALIRVSQWAVIPLILSVSAVVWYFAVVHEVFQKSVIRYYGLPIIVLAAVVFIVIYSGKGTGKGKWGKIITYLSKISFCVYLNQLFARAIAGRLLEYFEITGIVEMLLLFVLTSVLSIVCAALLHSLPDKPFFRGIKKSLGV